MTIVAYFRRHKHKETEEERAKRKERERRERKDKERKECQRREQEEAEQSVSGVVQCLWDRMTTCLLQGTIVSLSNNTCTG